MSLKVFNILAQTYDIVECERDFKLYLDLSTVLGLQTNVTVLKVKVKVSFLNFRGQLEHR